MKKLLAMMMAMAACVGVVHAGDDEEEADGPDMRPLAYIDAKSIQNKTDNPKANFSGLCDRLNNALVETGVYRVLTEEDISRIIDADGLLKVVAEGKKDAAVSSDVGFRLSMTVMTYGDTKSASVDLLSGAGKSVGEAKIELILKVVDMRTAETVKSKNLESSAKGAMQASQGQQTTSNLKEQLLQAATKDVCNKIVKELIMLTPFGVMTVEDGKAVVDVSPGLAKDHKLWDVKKCGKRVKNKRTGKWTYPEKKVATLKVEEVTDDTVTCSIVDGEIKPDEEAEEGCEYDKYRVRIAGSTGAVAPPPPVSNPPQGPVDPF